MFTTYASGDLPPRVLITGGDRTVEDTDDAAGETVSLVAVASDTDGIATGQFLVGGTVVATGQSASISLPDGNTVEAIEQALRTRLARKEIINGSGGLLLGRVRQAPRHFLLFVTLARTVGLLGNSLWLVFVSGQVCSDS